MEREIVYHNQRIQQRDLFRKLSGQTQDPSLAKLLTYTVPRTNFVDPSQAPQAFKDIALPCIGYENIASIPQPSTELLILTLLNLQPHDTVVEVGTASGHLAAAMSFLCKKVISYEIIPELAEKARERIAKLGRTNVEIYQEDGAIALLWVKSIDRMVFSAALPPNTELPPILFALKDGGICVAPIAEFPEDRTACTLYAFQRHGYELHSLAVQEGFSFVPLTGTYGEKK